ncbi:MAG: patatin-like phospholipase family protein [Myxococcales bacterium]|nr:patatin-like phospholipase family protein [Myxococcales bacterium]
MERALCLPGSGCRGAFQFGVMKRLTEAGETFDLVAGASSGSIAGAVMVAGLTEQGPDMFRSMSSTKIVSSKYLKSEGSPFGMARIVREALSRFVPNERIVDSDIELLVSTTRANRMLKSAFESAKARVRAIGAPRAAATPAVAGFPFHEPSPVHALAIRSEALVVHSNRTRRDMHDVIVASCSIPGLYARLPVLDGEVHVDGGAADNTLLSELLARGATDITVITPFLDGAVSPTLFERERMPRVPPHVRLRLISPARPIRLRHFDFDPDRLEEALEMPWKIEILEASAPPAVAAQR